MAGIRYVSNRMAGRLIISIALIATIGIAAFFPHVAWQLQRWLALGGDSGLNRAVIDEQTAQAELARLAPLAELLPERMPENLQLAEIYSRYPFSVHDELVINRGATNGVRSGEPVFLVTPSGPSSILIGVVQDVRDRTATVRTIFDPEFKAAVRIGTTGADALLLGGPEPKVSLIAENATVQPGDVIVAASPELPLGAPLASVGLLEPAEDQAFKNATVVFGYDIGAIRIVQIGSSAP